MKTGVVMPIGPDRMDNVYQVLTCLAAQTKRPEMIVLVCDGHVQIAEDVLGEELPDYPTPVKVISLPKHQPGLEQPRNIGVRWLEAFAPEVDHAWFVDSDVIFQADCLEQFVYAKSEAPLQDRDPILVGPYDWLPPGVRQPLERLYNDPRWPSFHAHPGSVVQEDLSAGLACFSGNLIWPINEFKRVGGFWNEIHHGRCEDGELGLRAVAMGVPIVFSPASRGWHMDHSRNAAWIEHANARDVPMLNARHPWVQDGGLFIVEEDGKRFNCRCRCGWEGNTALIWEHESVCDQGVGSYVPELA